jgi:hypothetical protein
MSAASWRAHARSIGRLDQQSANGRLDGDWNRLTNAVGSSDAPIVVDDRG